MRFDQLLVFTLSQVTSNGVYDFILNFSTFQFIQSVFSLHLGHNPAFHDTLYAQPITEAKLCAN